MERPTTTTTSVSWTPLTLSEARGFVTFYTVAYTPVLNSRRRQVSQDTMYINVSADSSSVTIVGLDGSLAYSVQVSAGTRAGQGVQSTAQVAETASSSNSGNAVDVLTSLTLCLNYRSDESSVWYSCLCCFGSCGGVCFTSNNYHASKVRLYHLRLHTKYVVIGIGETRGLLDNQQQCKMYIHRSLQTLLHAHVGLGAQARRN